MRAIIVAFGVVMIVAGLGPVKEYAPIRKPIRVHDIEHYKCRSD